VLVFVSTAASAGGACDELAARAFQKYEAHNESHAFEATTCGVTELSSLVAVQLLEQESDVFELRALRDNVAQATPSGRSLRLAGAKLTPDRKMLRVDWQLRTSESNRRVVVHWFELQRSGWYWQTIRPIRAGERIRPTDVQRMYGTVEHENRITWSEWPTSVRAEKPLGDGHTLRPTHVSKIPDLAAGDRAVLELQRGAIRLQLDADVQEAAYIDKTVKLKLRHSGAIVYGRLQANNIVVPCDSHVLHGRNVCTE